MMSACMKQTMHWLDEGLAHKEHGVNRGDVVVVGEQVGKVKSVARAWLRVPEVLVQGREWEAWVPMDQVVKL